jgi:hypothetical protein
VVRVVLVQVQLVAAFLMVVARWPLKVMQAVQVQLTLVVVVVVVLVQ